MKKPNKIKAHRMGWLIVSFKIFTSHSTFIPPFLPYFFLFIFIFPLINLVSTTGLVSGKRRINKRPLLECCGS